MMINLFRKKSNPRKILMRRARPLRSSLGRPMHLDLDRRPSSCHRERISPTLRKPSLTKTRTMRKRRMIHLNPSERLASLGRRTLPLRCHPVLLDDSCPKMKRRKSQEGLYSMAR
jgi:hypothetical protein